MLSYLLVSFIITFNCHGTIALIYNSLVKYSLRNILMTVYMLHLNYNSFYFYFPESAIGQNTNSQGHLRGSLCVQEKSSWSPNCCPGCRSAHRWQWPGRHLRDSTSPSAQMSRKNYGMLSFIIPTSKSFKNVDVTSWIGCTFLGRDFIFFQTNLYVVYFDQRSGARSSQKLVKIKHSLTKNLQKKSFMHIRLWHWKLSSLFDILYWYL